MFYKNLLQCSHSLSKSKTFKVNVGLSDVKDCPMADNVLAIALANSTVPEITASPQTALQVAVRQMAFFKVISEKRNVLFGWNYFQHLVLERSTNLHTRRSPIRHFRRCRRRYPVPALELEHLYQKCLHALSAMADALCVRVYFGKKVEQVNPVQFYFWNFLVSALCAVALINKCRDYVFSNSFVLWSAVLRASSSPD